ncbi:MAG: hypothetical protein CEN90_173, partial [Parcubacteria group bacterium Licking1014_17]
SPENSFGKTESALKPRHTARILGGQNPKKKNVLSIFRKNWARANPKSKEHFSLGLPSGARQWRGFHHSRIFDKVSSSEVVKTLSNIFCDSLMLFGSVAEWSIAPDCKSGGLAPTKVRILPGPQDRLNHAYQTKNPAYCSE